MSASLTPKSKSIYCPLYGYIIVTPFIQSIIDTEEFQRLRSIHQLGVSVYIFPGASHTRFEHSLGVFHLSTLVVEHLRELYPVVINESFEKCLNVAALCHDLGHLPFSHVADQYIAQKMPELGTHESRSLQILRTMILKYHFSISDTEFEMIGYMIIPEKYQNEHSLSSSPWQFSIVSSTHGFDIDRSDYVLRDSRNVGVGISFSVHKVHRIIKGMYIANGQLIFGNKIQREIDDLLMARFYLHTRVYQHPVSVAMEEMIFDIFDETQSLIDWKKNSWTFNDGLLQQLRYHPQCPKKALDLFQRIISRQFYRVFDVDLPYTFQMKKIDIDSWNQDPQREIHTVRKRTIGLQGQKDRFCRISFVLKNPQVVDTFKEYVDEVSSYLFYVNSPLALST